MLCAKNDIKELLPSYARQELEPAEAKVVKEHLAGCEDCRSELALLKMMAMDEVPDPGPAFWAEMPGRIERELRQQTKKKDRSLRDLLAGHLVPPWSWAPAAAAALVVLATWLALRPMPIVDAPQISSHELEYTEPADSVNMEELTPSQLAAASQWAQNQLAPIGRAINEDVGENMDRHSSEDLFDLNSEELDRLDKMLGEREQEVKKRIRQNRRNDKNIG